ncbi:hypothetical protein CBOM_01457 [Ceraceosorus bombacis]|uniref:DUF676 domain-containing protein n=1 Tax=Ceraceosorus bombacis TaxID=401625 RepID=A0A0P1BDR1_9BASI|nr:hypothetical protein CBOM_01457 [Ceraceosorus bombacis]
MPEKQPENQAAAPAPVAVYDAVPHTETSEPIKYRAGPIWSLINDFALFISQLYYLPLVLLPIGLKHGGLLQDMTIVGLLYQIIVSIVGVFGTAVLVFASFTGFPAPIWTSLALGTSLRLLTALQGPLNTFTVKSPTGHNFPNEAWLLVTGIATTPDGQRKACQRISDLFGRDVVAIVNRSYGLVGDLLECLNQRDLQLGYDVLVKALLDPKNKRVVLVGHSQGGIMVSAWIDQLLADYNRSILSKVEIYTFASAANHLSAPVDANGSMPFANIEHFANEFDYVSRIGVLAFTSDQQKQLPVDGKASYLRRGPHPKLHPNTPGRQSDKGLGADQAFERPVTIESRFAGRLFVRPRTGHLIVSHYLGKDSILDSPNVKRFSRLTQYRDGGSPA